MCQQGVKAFLRDLYAHDINDLEDEDWQGLADGFPDATDPQLLIQTCPLCNEPFPIVKRALQSEAYNLPDVAVYQRLRVGAPCLALAYVTNKTTLSQDPDKYAMLRERWQTLMWDVYQVAFVDVRDGALGGFCPTVDWGVGRPPPALSDIATALRPQLRQARASSQIPASSSRETEQALKGIISPIMSSYGYIFDPAKKVQGFWSYRLLDLLYRTSAGQNSIAIEVKVDEDWGHPVCQPLGYLLGHNAVLTIRVPKQEDQLDKETRELVTKAESMLEATGRARFVYVWPESR